MKAKIIVILLVVVGVTTGFAQLGDEYVTITVTSEGKTKISQSLFPKTFVSTIDVHIISEKISNLLAIDEKNILLGTTQNQDLLKIATLGASAVDLKYNADILTYKSGVFKLKYDSELESRVSLPPLSKLVSLNTIPIEISDEEYVLPPGDISLSFTIRPVTSKEFFVPVGDSEYKVEAITAAKIEEFSANADEIQFIIKDRAIVLTIIPKEVMSNPNDAKLNGEEVDFSQFHQNSTHSWIRVDPHEKGLVKILGTGEKLGEGGGCLIATATYGTEMAPQVQFLREIRDNQLMNTDSGMSFMTGFNQLYYSFSPYIADLERENPIFKEFVKIGITPLLSSLSIMTFAESEHEILGFGIGVILMNIGMYFVLPFVILYKIRYNLRTTVTSQSSRGVISSYTVQSTVNKTLFGIIGLLVLTVSVSSALEPAYAAEAGAIQVILDISYENIQESLEDVNEEDIAGAQALFELGEDQRDIAMVALQNGDLELAEESALSAMDFFEDSAVLIGEILEVQEATIQPLGLSTAAASIFNVQEGITNSDDEANELRDLIKINNFDDITFTEYDESVNLAKALLADGYVPDAQAQLALANQIKDNLYAQIGAASDENTVEEIQERLGEQDNLGLTKQDVKELENILADLTDESSEDGVAGDDGAPGNSGDAPGQNNEDAPGNSGDAPGQNNEDAPGNSGDAPGQNNEDAPGNSGDAPGQNNDNKDFDDPEDIPGSGAAGENPSANANGQGLGLGKIPPGLAKLFGYDDGTGENEEFDGPVPPGSGAAGENPNANGQGLGLGKIPPGLYNAFNDKPDDFFENNYEAEIDDVFEVNYDGTNRGSSDGKGMFGAWAGKSGQDPTTGQFINKDKGQGNQCGLTKGIDDGDALNVGPFSIGFTYFVDLVTAIGLGCNDVTDIVFFAVTSPNGTNLSDPVPFFLNPPTFRPDTDGTWIIDMGVQVYTEQRIITVDPTAGFTASAGPDQLLVPVGTVNLSGSGTGAGTLSYEWQIVRISGTGPPITVDDVDPSDGDASFDVLNPHRGNEYELTLIVRDDGNYGYVVDTLTVTVAP